MNINSNHFKKSFSLFSFPVLQSYCLSNQCPAVSLKKCKGYNYYPVQDGKTWPNVFEYNTDKYKKLKLKNGKTIGLLPNNKQQDFPDQVTSKHSPYMFGKIRYRYIKNNTIDENSLIPALSASKINRQRLKN